MKGFEEGDDFPPYVRYPPPGCPPCHPHHSHEKMPGGPWNYGGGGGGHGSPPQRMLGGHPKWRPVGALSHPPEPFADGLG